MPDERAIGMVISFIEIPPSTIWFLLQCPPASTIANACVVSNTANLAGFSVPWAKFFPCPNSHGYSLPFSSVQ